MLKCWADLPGYESYVRDKWASYNIEGWGAFVLKEKLKLLKKKSERVACQSFSKPGIQVRFT